jgi:sulfonate transport system substrate-binding protein
MPLHDDRSAKRTAAGKRFGLIFAGLLAFSGVFGTAALQPARAADKITVVMSSYGFLYLPVLTAKELGYYDKEGIDVTVTATSGGSKALAAVTGGGANIYVGAPSSALHAREHGAPVTVFGAVMTQYSSNIAIRRDWAKKFGITEKSSYKDKLKALKGITIGITSAGSGTDQLVRFLAKQAGLRPDRDMTITALGSGQAMLAAFSQNRIQGFSHSAPDAEEAAANHDGILLFNFSKGEVKPLDGFLYVAAIAREDWLKAHPDLAVRFLRATQHALDTLHDPKGTVKAMNAVHAKYQNRTDMTFYKYVWNNTTGAFPKTVALTGAAMQRVADFANEFEKKKLKPDTLAKSWTDTYAAKALSSAK